MTWRFLPPKGYDTVAPCTVASGVRMKLVARSKISCSWSVVLLNPSCRIGTLAASYLRTWGGNVPGGMLRTWTWHCVTICESARSTSTVGWKNTRTTAMLWCDCDSMCSMPTTLEVSARSKFVTMRLSISSGVRPLYCQTMLTTGMSMYGKMSTGVVAIATPPRMAIRTAATTNVYGRRRASLTIHIGASTRRPRATSPIADAVAKRAVVLHAGALGLDHIAPGYRRTARAFAVVPASFLCLNVGCVERRSLRHGSRLHGTSFEHWADDRPHSGAPVRVELAA